MLKRLVRGAENSPAVDLRTEQSFELNWAVWSLAEPIFARHSVFLCFLALVLFSLFTDGGNVTLSEWRPLWNAADDRF